MSEYQPNPACAAGELLPCPFCGPGESVVDLWHDDVAHRWRVGCGRCGCSTGTHPRDKSQEPAIAAWNRRAAASTQAAVQAVQPFGWAPVGGSNYFTRNESSAKRIGGLVPVYLQPATPVASDSDVRRDAARYRWLVKNCFDWAAPGDGDSFDHIELHFEHDMLNRDDESVGAAIDSEIDRALTAAQSASRGQA